MIEMSSQQSAGPFYVETRVMAPIESDALMEFVAHPALLGVWEDDGVVHLYWEPTGWDEHLLARLREGLRQSGVDDAALTIHRIPAEDWNAKWAASVEPIRIGQRVIIRPTWKSVESSIRDIELVIDPKQAFGTGHHATTQLLIEWLEDHIEGGERLLDVGTGSGILAMVALRLGASYALAVDHDPVAIACAREYAAANGFGQELSIECGTLDDLTPAPFGVIVANLDRRTILSLFDQFQRFADASTVLQLSGVLQEDEKEIVQAGKRHGWLPIGTKGQDGWLAIGLQRERFIG